MAFSKEFGEHILDMLEPLGPLTLKRMFGGACINYGRATFALMFDDTIYFRVDEANIERFRDADSEPFRYAARGKDVIVGSYYLVPEEVLDDVDKMVDWARGALDAGLKVARAKQAKGKGK